MGGLRGWTAGNVETYSRPRNAVCRGLRLGGAWIGRRVEVVVEEQLASCTAHRVPRLGSRQDDTKPPQALLCLFSAKMVLSAAARSLTLSQHLACHPSQGSLSLGLTCSPL